MDMLFFVPHAEYVGPLTWLGRHDWLRFEPGPRGVLLARPDCSLLHRIGPTEVRRYGAAFMNRVAGFLLDGSIHPLDLLSFFARSRVLAGGPKLFRPTADQCRAMEHTEANVRFSDYRQPFPGVIVEWPAEFRREKEGQFGRPFPAATIAYHEPALRGVLTDTYWGTRDHVVTPLTPYRPDRPDIGRVGREEAEAAAGRAEPAYDTLEDALRGAGEAGGTGGPIGADAPLVRLAQRLAVNLNLLLLTLGHRDAGPADPVSHDRLARHSRDRRDRKAATAARAALSGEVRLVAFEQEVRLFDTEAQGGDGERPAGLHASPRPHWRRGHIRRQHHGAGNASVKLVFVRPVLVRRSAFVGDVSATSVVYRG